MVNEKNVLPELSNQLGITQKIFFLFIILLIAGSLSACSSAVASEVECSGDFEATVHSGQNAGLSMSGNLSLHIQPTGNFFGTLTPVGSPSVQVTGYAVNQALNLVFDLGDARYLFGVGSAQYDIRECKGVAGGPFTGPESGDSGDWAYALGGGR